MWSVLIFFLGLFFLGGDLIQFPVVHSEEETDQLAFMAQVAPSLSLQVEGGTNDRGRRTFLSGGSVPFGSLLYTRAETITNGDAFYDVKQRLHLEATLDIQVTAGGIATAAVDVGRVGGSPTPFKEFLYSLGVRKEDKTDLMPTLPETVKVSEIQGGSGKVSLRIIGVIDPSQSGAFSDTVRIHAQSLP